MSNNYVLGRGRLYFDLFATGTENTTGERYLGNTPAFSLTIEAEKLDHFSSEGGLREKDASIVLETTRSGTFSCDNISRDNLALFFFGASSTITQAAIAGPATETITMGRDRYYQIGTTAGRPTGLRNITVTSIATVSPSATAAVDTDYVVDGELGRIYINPASPFFSTDKEVVVTYSAAASTRDLIVSGANPIQGAMRFISANPTGTQRDYFMPKVELTPAGEYSLKGEDWSVMEFQVEVLKKGTLEALYLDGRPVLS